MSIRLILAITLFPIIWWALFTVLDASIARMDRAAGVGIYAQ